MKITDPDFFDTLKESLPKKNQVEIDNFMCKDWNVYYELYNPENFEDPLNPPGAWYDPNSNYEYYEKPFRGTEHITIYTDEEKVSLTALQKLIKNSDSIEQEILSTLVNYTFGNGGAYAEGKHYAYAKKTIELFHNTTFTDEEFIKRNLRIDTIVIPAEKDEVHIDFRCGWDGEHGIIVKIKNNKVKEVA
ncbi:DUF6985 domain-containing protein [Chondrinema litorale]|uniref:DUF6985 domain-containing protein n=1 Tax=Chondrinema litorale TaxID=2994555 RepID=UPI002542E3F1|nr:hypothetical protein [Chondrinema litorale]UZR98095.1 hypothetical protein OQ292_30175 [Chondrinema litorale]